MDRGERKEELSLPPDYVSLAQLQERWLKKQEEKKLKEKQEEERRESEAGKNLRGVKNDGHEKLKGRSIRDVPRRRLEKEGREMGVIGEEGKGKEILIGGFENGEKKKKKKKKKKHSEKKKSVADGEEGNGVEKEKPTSEVFDGGDGCGGVEIIPRNEVKMGIPGVLSGESKGGIYGESKGTEETSSVSMVEVLPTNGVGGEVPFVKRKLFRGGFRRNGDNRGSGYKIRKEYKVKLHESKDNEVKLGLEKKMEDEKGYVKKWSERRRNGDYQNTLYRLKETRAEMRALKGDEVELKSEKKEEDEIPEVGSEVDGLKGRDGNEFLVQSNIGRNKTKEHRVEGEGLKENKVALEKKVGDEILVVESAKVGEKGVVGNGLRRYGNWSGKIGRKFGGSTFNDWKADNVRSRVEVNVGDSWRYASSGRFEHRRRMKQRNSGLVWVKKEEKTGACTAEVGSSGISGDQE